MSEESEAVLFMEGSHRALRELEELLRGKGLRCELRQPPDGTGKG